jgi:hypothetical protein
MILSIDGQPGDVSSRVTYLSAGSPAKSDARVGKAMRADDPWAHRTEGQVADLKRRIPILKRLIADCDLLAAGHQGPLNHHANDRHRDYFQANCGV